MKGQSIARKLLILVVMNGLFMALSLGYFILLLNTATTTANRLMSQIVSLDEGAFRFLNGINALQNTIQVLLREKDTDKLEVLVATIEKLKAEAGRSAGLFLKDDSELPKELGSLNAVSKEIVDLVLVGEAAAARQGFIENFPPVAEKLFERIEALRQKLTGRITTERDSHEQTVRSSILVATALSLGLVLAICALLFLVLNRVVVRALKALNGVMTEIARGEGDLTQKLQVRSNDEIGRSAECFNLFIGSLNSMVLKMKASAESLKGSSQDLAANMQQTAAAVNQITANIDSVKQMVANQGASVSETSSTIEQIVRNIESLNAQIETQASSVTGSSASIEQMVANIQAISANLDKVSGTIGRLVAASEKGKSRLALVTSTIKAISDQSETLMETNKVISNVASQTNLLAMNAAIEAAHAGAAGRGFAVVADEIRGLAERSTQQSKGVARDLKAVKTSIDGVVGAAEEADTAFEEVLVLINSVSQLEQEVKQAMSEQATGSRQVLEGLTQINNITSQVKSGSSEMAAGSSVMLKEMGRLLELSQQVQNSMDEISSGTGEINRAVNAVSDLTVKTSEDIGVLVNLTGRFKTTEDDFAACRESDSQ